MSQASGSLTRGAGITHGRRHEWAQVPHSVACRRRKSPLPPCSPRRPPQLPRGHLQQRRGHGGGHTEPVQREVARKVKDLRRIARVKRIVERVAVRAQRGGLRDVAAVDRLGEHDQVGHVFVL